MSTALARSIAACLAAVVLLAHVAPSHAKPSRRPNVIVIYTDDQGSVDMGVYGVKDLKTPHLDALAKRGVMFRQMYAPAPVCSPSRAGLLTGRYPVRAGVPGNVSSARGKDGMPAELVTIADMLKASGYATAHIGKWHLGYTPKTMPNGQGFDHSFGHMGGCIDNYSHFFYWNGPNRHDLWRQGKEVFADGEYFPKLMVGEAVSFMTKHRQKPFFIYFALNTPHYPYQGHANWLKKYNDAKVPYPRNLYNAFVSTTDEYIGMLVAALDKLKLRDDTIVIFQSDHGHSVEVRAHSGGGENGPYRGHKFTMFEGGIRVPSLVSWPKGIPQGQERTQMVHGCDWLPTIAEYCGAKPPAGVDGKSIAKVIADAKADSPHEVLHWQLGNGRGARWAIRKGPWKLMGNVTPPTDGPKLSARDRQFFLANIETDPGEQKNLASDHPDKLAELKKLHAAWADSLP